MTETVKRVPALRAIRQNCVQCSGGTYRQVALCQVQSCPLWPYRFGVTPEAAAKRGREVVPHG